MAFHRKFQLYHRMKYWKTLYLSDIYGVIVYRLALAWINIYKAIIEHLSLQNRTLKETMCNSNSTQGCGFAFLYHMAVFHLRNCMEFLTRPLSNEKVVRPALIYSLFPNVPPTIYFGTPDERGKPGRVSTWNSPQEKVASEAGGRVEGAFQNVCTGAWLPTWSTSPMKESLSCPSFSWPSWPHNLMCHS